MVFSEDAPQKSDVGSDIEVSEACRRGDRGAFARLFEARRYDVYSTALRFAGDPAAGLDIARAANSQILIE